MTLETLIVHSPGGPLACSRYVPHRPPIGQLLSIHGAGPAGRELIDYLLRDLTAELDLECVTFDFPGHGESPGSRAKSSLQQRVAETKVVIDALISPSPIILVATSMGGHIALELLPALSVSHLILFCPAVYAAEAYGVRFDSGFTEILRTPQSYRSQQVLQNLQQFTGKVLILVGTEDKIIPPEVIALYEGSIPSGAGQVVWLPGAEHVIHRWARKSPQAHAVVLDAVTDFLKPG